MACLGSGLGEHELAAIEATHGFRFPPDLRDFLASRPIPKFGRKVLSIREVQALGDSAAVEQEEVRGWMNWRVSDAEIRTRLDWPFDGVADYFVGSGYWLPGWGPRPPALEERLAFLRTAPLLIPVAGRCYMAAEPCEAGNPVFSLHGIDIIVIARDLDELVTGQSSMATTRHIRFWSDVMSIHWSGW